MFEQIGWESASPRGKIFYLKHLKNRSILDRLLLRSREPSSEFIQSIYQCAECGACEEICHESLNLRDIWLEVKESLVRHERALPDPIANLPDILKEYHSPYGKIKQTNIPTKRNELYSNQYKLPKKAKYVFFIGCATSSFVDSMVHSSFRILRKANVDFTVIADEWCCASVLALTGHGSSEVFREHARHNMSQIKATGAHMMIAACPWCYKSFSEMYPKYTEEPDFEIIHFTQFLMELMDKGKIRIEKPFEKQVTYHDPCKLGRLSGIFEPPRKILENIPGIKLVELLQNKSNCDCCGNYCGINSFEPELSLNMSLKKIHEALDTSSGVLVSSCPNCKHGLGNAVTESKKRDTQEKEDLDLEIIDLTELVAQLI